MAKSYDLFLGAYSHFSGRNEATGRGARYNKVNILGGLFRYEKAQKTLNGQNREHSSEISGLFGALRYTLHHGNGVKEKQIRAPLYKRDDRTVQSNGHSLKRTDGKAFFFWKIDANPEWKYDGVVQNAKMPPAEEKKLDQKEAIARNVYGDRFIGNTDPRPKNMHKYALKQSLKTPVGPALNDVSIKSMTTGGILKATEDTLDVFVKNKNIKQVKDAFWRETIWKTGVVGTVAATLGSAFAATGGLAGVIGGIALATYVYDKYRKGKNASDASTLQTKRSAVQNEVRAFEHAQQQASQGTGINQDRMVYAIEEMHFEMEKQISGRKGVNRLELFATAGSSMGIGMSLANAFPGINTMAYIGGGVGTVHAASKYAAEQKRVDKMQDVADLFDQVRQNVLYKPILLGPAPGKPNPNA